jgi:hypothetical protein
MKYKLATLWFLCIGVITHVLAHYRLIGPAMAALVFVLLFLLSFFILKVRGSDTAKTHDVALQTTVQQHDDGGSGFTVRMYFFFRWLL